MSETTPRVPRLLVVEDDADMAEMLVRLAQKAGCEARALLGTGTLLDELRAWQPHIVTLDLVMPGADIYDVLKQMKSSGYAGKLIIVSGQREALLAATAAHARAAGLDVAASLHKPIDFAEFCALVSRLAAPPG